MAELRPIGFIETIPHVGVFRLVGYNTDITGKQTERFEKAGDIPTPTTNVAPGYKAPKLTTVAAVRAKPRRQKHYKQRTYFPSKAAQQEIDKENNRVILLGTGFFMLIGLLLAFLKGLLVR